MVSRARAGLWSVGKYAKRLCDPDRNGVMHCNSICCATLHTQLLGRRTAVIPACRVHQRSECWELRFVKWDKLISGMTDQGLMEATLSAAHRSHLCFMITYRNGTCFSMRTWDCRGIRKRVSVHTHTCAHTEHTQTHTHLDTSTLERSRRRVNSFAFHQHLQL